MSPKSHGEVAFSSRSVAIHMRPGLLCAGGKDVGLKPSGGDVLKPRKRSSVIVSGNSREQQSPNWWTFPMFSEGKPGQNPLRSRLS